MYGEADLRVGTLVLGRKKLRNRVFVWVGGFTFMYSLGVEVERPSVEVTGARLSTYAGIVFSTTVRTAVELQS
jgi:hypothetical protein